jgi:hypothetical protein
VVEWLAKWMCERYRLCVADPAFVASFDIGQYVYFFFRETAVEYANCGAAVYSRVARICKVSVNKTSRTHGYRMISADDRC